MQSVTNGLRVAENSCPIEAGLCDVAMATKCAHGCNYVKSYKEADAAQHHQCTNVSYCLQCGVVHS